MNMKQRILAIDDESDILRLLEYNLGKAGYDCIAAEDGPEALEIAKRTLPDLIILDVMLPNMAGTDVLKELKFDPETRSIPVIMLTAKGEEIDRIIGFELGADDYLVKPFSPKELVLRIQAILKKGASEKKTADIIKAGPLSIDTEKFLVSDGNKRLDLTATEFRIIVELVKLKGRPVSRESLVRKISGINEEYASFRTIDTHIRRLRVKLGPYSGCIETVRGFGYRFAPDSF